MRWLSGIVRHLPGRSVEISTPSQGGFRYTRCRKDRAERHPPNSVKQPDCKETKIITHIHRNETDSTNVSARYFGRTPRLLDLRLISLSCLAEEWPIPSLKLQCWQQTTAKCRLMARSRLLKAALTSILYKLVVDAGSKG